MTYRLKFPRLFAYSGAMRHPLPHHRRLTVARRLASGHPAWVVARASRMEPEQLGEMMLEPGFGELVGSLEDLLAMDEQARLAKLYRIAEEIVADAVLHRDPFAALYLQYQKHLGRNPHRSLQQGLDRALKAEIRKAEKVRAEVEAGRLMPETPLPEPPPPPEPLPVPRTLAEAVAACEAAALLPPDRHVHPVDAMLWRKAGSLRRAMLDEQVLHHLAAEREATERRRLPMELDEVEAIEARQVAEHGRRLAKAAPGPEPAGGHGLSAGDLQALREIRAMYRRLPPERLVAICQRPPRGMERLFAVLAEEIGIRPGQPQGP